MYVAISERHGSKYISYLYRASRSEQINAIAYMIFEGRSIINLDTVYLLEIYRNNLS